MIEHPFYNSERASESGQRIFHDVTLFGASREPCPVCGHPTGDCPGESGPPASIAGLAITPTIKAQQTFYVEEDIYEERQITPFNKIRVLVHRKGKQIPLEEAERLGLWSPPESWIDFRLFQY